MKKQKDSKINQSMFDTYIESYYNAGWTWEELLLVKHRIEELFWHSVGATEQERTELTFPVPLPF